MAGSRPGRPRELPRRASTPCPRIIQNKLSPEAIAVASTARLRSMSQASDKSVAVPMENLLGHVDHAAGNSPLMLGRT
jgi:hypothetical protein